MQQVDPTIEHPFKGLPAAEDLNLVIGEDHSHL